MGKIISNIADTYELYSLHKKYSKNDQFNYTEEKVSALNSDFSKFYIIKKDVLKFIDKRV